MVYLAPERRLLFRSNPKIEIPGPDLGYPHKANETLHEEVPEVMAIHPVVAPE
jgi:hypothetical protein